MLDNEKLDRKVDFQRLEVSQFQGYRVLGAGKNL